MFEGQNIDHCTGLKTHSFHHFSEFYSNSFKQFIILKFQVKGGVLHKKCSHSQYFFLLRIIIIEKNIAKTSTSTSKYLSSAT